MPLDATYTSTDDCTLCAAESNSLLATNMPAIRTAHRNTYCTANSSAIIYAVAPADFPTLKMSYLNS